MSAAEESETVFYGNWRQPSKAGLGKLSAAATFVLFVSLVATLIVNMVAGLLPAFATAVVSGAVLFSLIRKDGHGLTRLHKIGERMVFWKARRRGLTVYRSGPAGVVPTGTCQLPGVLTATRVAEFTDSWSRPFAVIAHPAVSTYAVVLAVQPDGDALVDQYQIDVQVARWGHWLAALSGEPGLVGASVVVETIPDSGTRLRQEIHSHIDARAPELAKRVMEEIQAVYPVGSAAVSCYITLTFTAATAYRFGGARRSIEEFGREIATRIPGLTGALSGTGAGTARPVGAEEIARIVRVAYDPAAQALFDEAALAGQTVHVDWADAGPAGADALRDRYVHDSGVSRTWMMTGAPTGQVQSNLLARVLGPNKRVPRKRVALLFRPIESARAADIVDRDVNDASARLGNMRRPTERAKVAYAQAVRTSREEAQGAGLENFGMVVTATGTSSSELADITATVEAVGAAARLKFRLAYGAQDSAFVTGLPVGVVPRLHSRVSERVREAL